MDSDEEHFSVRSDELEDLAGPEPEVPHGEHAPLAPPPPPVADYAELIGSMLAINNHQERRWLFAPAGTAPETLRQDFAAFVRYVEEQVTIPAERDSLSERARLAMELFAVSPERMDMDEIAARARQWAAVCYRLIMVSHALGLAAAASGNVHLRLHGVMRKVLALGRLLESSILITATQTDDGSVFPRLTRPRELVPPDLVSDTETLLAMGAARGGGAGAEAAADGAPDDESVAGDGGAAAGGGRRKRRRGSSAGGLSGAELRLAGGTDAAIARVVRYMLERLHVLGYARRGQQVWRQIRTPTDPATGRDFPTHAWTPVCDIQRFIHNEASRMTAYDIWKQIANPRIVRDVTKFLTDCVDVSFPELEPCRSDFAFRNGILRAGEVPVDAGGDEVRVIDGAVLPQPPTVAFYPYAAGVVPQDVVACNYHDVDLDPAWILGEGDPMDLIPTPSLDRIVDYQLETQLAGAEDPAAELREVKRWLYALMGRLLHEGGRYDNWAVALTLKGLPGTGKSTIIEVMLNCYRPEDTGTLAAKGDKYSFAAVSEFYIAACPEMGTATFDRLTLQQAISNEAVSLRGMNEQWRTAKWTTGFIFSGNEMGFAAGERHGAMARRTVMINFARAIAAADKDPRLRDKLRMETGAIICKIARCYADAVAQHGAHDLWGTYVPTDADGRPQHDAAGRAVSRHVLPRYFHEQMLSVRSAGNPLTRFLLEQARVLHIDPRAIEILGRFRERVDGSRNHVVSAAEMRVAASAGQFPDVFMPLSIFKELAMAFIRENCSTEEQKDFRLTTEQITSVCENFGLFLFYAPRGTAPLLYRGRPHGGQWIANVAETEVALEAAAAEEPAAAAAAPAPDARSELEADAFSMSMDPEA